MARAFKWVQAADLQGFKYFEMVSKLVQRLRPVGAERDRRAIASCFAINLCY